MGCGALSLRPDFRQAVFCVWLRPALGRPTRTDADVWSIEAAVESGRRAAQVFEPGVPVLPQYRPRLLRALGRMDDVLYRHGGPHVLQVLVVTGALAIVASIVVVWSR